MNLNPIPPIRPLHWPPLIEELAKSAADPSRLYLVGGVVRDALHGQPIHDYDFATPDDGLHIARKLANALDGAYYPVDPERHTGRIILETEQGRVMLDIASLRGDDLLADLKGRDFTVNAIAARLDDPEHLIDPLGGQDDLFTHKVLRQCSPTSIANDPIRAMRAVRQSLQLGLHIEHETIQAIREFGPTLRIGPDVLDQPERVRDELFKILDGKRRAGALRLMNALGLLAVICPFPLPDEIDTQFTRVEKLEQLLTIISSERTDDTAAELTLGIAVMVLDRYRTQLQTHFDQDYGARRSRAALNLLGAFSPDGVKESWGEWLRLSNTEARLLASLEHLDSFNRWIDQPPDNRAIHRYFRKMGEAGIDGVLVGLASYLAREGYQLKADAWGQLLDQAVAPILEAYFHCYDKIVAPRPLLNGNEIKQELALRPGRQIGRIINSLVEEQAAGVITTRDEAVQFAKQQAGYSPGHS